jgi:hypothetical protein
VLDSLHFRQLKMLSIGEVDHPEVLYLPVDRFPALVELAIGAHMLPTGPPTLSTATLSTAASPTCLFIDDRKLPFPYAHAHDPRQPAPPTHPLRDLHISGRCPFVVRSHHQLPPSWIALGPLHPLQFVRLQVHGLLAGFPNLVIITLDTMTDLYFSAMVHALTELRPAHLREFACADYEYIEDLDEPGDIAWWSSTGAPIGVEEGILRMARACAKLRVVAVTPMDVDVQRRTNALLAGEGLLVRLNQTGWAAV